MKQSFKIQLSHLLFLITFTSTICFSQNATLKITVSTIDHYNQDYAKTNGSVNLASSNINVLVLSNLDTIYYDSSYLKNNEIILDSLQIGEYKIILSNKTKDQEFYSSKKVTLYNEKTVRVDFDISNYVYLSDLSTTSKTDLINEELIVEESEDIEEVENPLDILLEKIEEDSEYEEEEYDFESDTSFYSEGLDDLTELQFKESFIKGNWLGENTPIQTFYSLSFTGSNWFKVNKHMGILFGSGFGYSQYNINKNFPQITSNEYKKINEKYQYVDLNLDLKFRFTFGNQMINEFGMPKFRIDIGALYNFPISFKDVAKFENNKRTTIGSIHQFTDVRTYVNIGFDPYSFFIEYRVFDFLNGSNIEIPRFNAGLKLTITD